MGGGDLDVESLRRLDYIEEFDALNITSDKSHIPKYPAKQHALSVAKHLGVKTGLIYLQGRPSALIEDSDQPKTFRQRRYFYYLSGADFENCVATYNIEKDDLRLFIPIVDPKTVIWLGSTPSIEECEAKYDVDVVDYTTKLRDYVGSLLDEDDELKIYALHEDQAPSDLGDRLDSSLLLPAMDAARVIKSDYEISMIRNANDVSAQAHERVLKAIAWVDNEAQIEAVFAGQCIARKAKKQAYGIIAASGPNSATLHYQANDEPLEGRQLVCLDAGCEWDCYASDVTRTFPISGTFSEEALEIYSIVEDMQEACIKLVKPGVVFRSLHLLAMSIAIRGLMKLGVLHNGTYSEIFATGSAFFPHGLGHHLGLEVHDVSGAQRLLADISTIHDIRASRHRLLASTVSASSPPYTGTQKLEPGMVITIEPGIYFSRYALEEVYLKDPKHAKYINKEKLERYYPVGGVRIEDDILVTQDGYENLTTAPKGEEACKIIRKMRNIKDRMGMEMVENGLHMW